MKTHIETKAQAREVGHSYVTGLPGAGKSTLLTNVIERTLTSGDHSIVHDPSARLDTKPIQRVRTDRAPEPKQL